MSTESGDSSRIEVLAGPDPETTIVKLSGPLTIRNFFDFQDLIRRKPYPKLLLVDIADVPYLDSAALGSLVGLHVSCEGNNRRYAIVGANERVRTLFDLTHTSGFLILHSTIAKAQAAFA